MTLKIFLKYPLALAVGFLIYYALVRRKGGQILEIRLSRKQQDACEERTQKYS